MGARDWTEQTATPSFSRRSTPPPSFLRKEVKKLGLGADHAQILSHVEEVLSAFHMRLVREVYERDLLLRIDNPDHPLSNPRAPIYSLRHAWWKLVKWELGTWSQSVRTEGKGLVPLGPGDRGAGREDEPGRHGEQPSVEERVNWKMFFDALPQDFGREDYAVIELRYLRRVPSKEAARILQQKLERDPPWTATSVDKRYAKLVPRLRKLADSFGIDP